MTTPASTLNLKPDSAKATQSRNIFGTLTVPPEKKFTGSQEETATILKIIRDSCPAIVSLILQQEKHKDGDNRGNLHYHFLVCTKSPMRQTKLSGLKDRLAGAYPGRHDVQFAKSVKAVELYLFKEYELHHPYTEGYSQTDLESLKRIVDDTTPKVVKTANPNRYEAQLMEETREFMVANQYSINFYTRAVHGRNGKDRDPVATRLLFQHLATDTDVPEDYGIRGLDLIEKHIRDLKSYSLPYHVPDRDYISFNDALYSFTAGKRYDLDDPAVKDVAPIRHFDVAFPGPTPTSYLFLIKHHGWPLQGFIEKYGAMFRPKSHRDPCMYLWGPPLTGKSMFYIPLIEVLGDLASHFARDGNFSLADLPGKLAVILDEVDIWGGEDLRLDLVKRLLEGTRFAVSVKNRGKGMAEPVHTFIASNIKPPSSTDDRGIRDYHIEAVLSRIHPYETKDLVSRDENIIRSIAAEHSPGWAVYCTQSEPYITIPPEYL